MEGGRKDLKRGRSILKIKVRVFTFPNRLHHQDGIYYGVRACILMQNMMADS
jgi:hypothetical protein